MWWALGLLAFVGTAAVIFSIDYWMWSGDDE